MKNFFKTKPGTKVLLEEIPLLHFYDFYNCVISEEAKKFDVVHFFSFSYKGRAHLLLVLRDHENIYLTITYPSKEYSAITIHNKRYHMFERELHEDDELQILPAGHPWLKPVRKNPANHPFWELISSDTHLVGVGPVHAGVIEPGHFRFTAIGEKVLRLEISLGYQHRGVEKLLLKSPPKRWPIIIGGITGDSAVAHESLYSQIKDISLENDAIRIRTLAQELERISNHVGDLGALGGDVALLAPANYFGRMRGDFLNMLLLLSGNRFGKGLNLTAASLAFFPEIKKRVKQLEREIKNVAEILFGNSTLQSRFQGLGVLRGSDAREIGVVGMVARSCGIEYDVRKNFPYDAYKDQNILNQLTVASEQTGDVWGRAQLRYKEILNSIRIIYHLVDDNMFVNFENHSKNNNTVGASVNVAMVEGWRGEISHCLIYGDDGAPIKYKIKDSSFHNWMALAIAMRSVDIYDFPICNKSFNLSYCGFDL